jgi:hypothetical protein
MVSSVTPKPSPIGARPIFTIEVVSRDRKPPTTRTAAWRHSAAGILSSLAAAGAMEAMITSPYR